MVLSKRESERLSARALELIELEDKYGAHNYHPLPVVLSRGEGPYLYDVDNKQYFDFLAAYSAVNQGHCHPRILSAMYTQAQQLTLTSRAFFNDRLGKAEKRLCDLFKYDKALLMNGGVEAVESSIKLARKWGYTVKKVHPEKASIIVANENFHGRTTGVVSFSTDPESYSGFGPYMPGYIKIKYNDIPSLEAALKSDSNIVAFLVEPLQGEAGVIVPDEGYLSQAHKLCKEHNVLLMADEIQCGLGRTGRMLCSEYDQVRPDVLLLGKALSGGFMPVSAVLTDDEVMLSIKPGQHGSTFGGGPLACAVLEASLDVLIDEKLCEKSAALGLQFRNAMEALKLKRPNIIKAVRGRGLMNAVVISGADAWDVCLSLRNAGLLAKPTHGDTIRFTPPLVLSCEEMERACGIIESVIMAC